ncbi:DUF4159 domain-containing protein [Pseudomonas veronii]|uniref:DUF4159 domain-containing protein n=1 Tax=Pseudomonas veronii TaxID=76761 RepID=A0A4P7Y7T6_PSEVE|nr:DUF4159 domain-containing protein [Pseudomonas veronii]QCG67304.1 DUF4159 domain-containing protein [Pseudomonas veronii]
MPKHQPELAPIYNVFGLSSNHELSTLLVNVENSKRFSDLLHAVEREFFMVPGEPSDEPEDEGLPGDYECLVNSWGSTESEYLKQFRAALETIASEEVKALRRALGGMLFAFDDGVGREWSQDLLDFARKVTPAVEFKRVTP